MMDQMIELCAKSEFFDATKLQKKVVKSEKQMNQVMELVHANMQKIVLF